jgi:hypothetical protein
MTTRGTPLSTRGLNRRTAQPARRLEEDAPLFLFGAGLVWFEHPSNAGKAYMRVKRKRARGQFPRCRGGLAVHVLSFISFSLP